jgi:hypothetical protein
MTKQEQIRSLLLKSGIAAKEVKVFGSQILVTCWSKDAAGKWATLLGKFARVRGVVASSDETKDADEFFKANPGVVKSSVTHRVWRVGAVI